MIYSETCILRPPLGAGKGGHYLQVVFISRSNLHMIRTVCSEKGGLKIQVVFRDSGHIIQVSLYMVSNWRKKDVNLNQSGVVDEACFPHPAGILL